jgi:SAM-dependent methyltransferase
VPALPDFFDLLYDQLWSPEWVQQEFESDYKDFIFRAVLDGLSTRTAAGPRLLDIGAHAGRFMHLAKNAGWQPEGIELNPCTAKYAATRTGLPVHAVNVDRLPLSDRRYGAITLIDVLEHVPEPLTLLSRIDDALEAGGWVAVKVPSGPAQRLKERVRARIHRGYRPRLADNLVHVNHFSPAALQAALQRVGLQSVTVDIAPPELPPADGYRGRISNLVRRSLYHGGRLLPYSVETPLALNLLAFAQKPA